MIAKNLKYLRKSRKITQEEMSVILGVSRTTMGDYERGHTEPNIKSMVKMANFFKVSLDELLRSDLSNEKMHLGLHDQMKVLTITTDKESRHQVELVETKASAGYIDGYSDPEYIKELPIVSLPNLGSGIYRAFEIEGESMLPMESGSIIIAKHIDKIDNIKDNKTYVVISKNDGVVYKRVILNQDKSMIYLLSDNPDFKPFHLHYDQIDELWEYHAHVGFTNPKEINDTLVDQRIGQIHEKLVQRN